MAEQNNENRNEDLGELLKIRRQKLADLQAAGKDPFQITKYDQTHHTDEVKKLYTELEEAVRHPIRRDLTRPQPVR